MRAHPSFALLLVLAAAVAFGCVGRSPTPSYYTLAAAPGTAAPAPVAARPDLGVAIGPITFPRYLDRPELVTRSGDHGLALANDRRWAGSMRNDFGRVVAGEVGRLLGTDRVVTWPDEARWRVDFRVPLELVAFEGALGQSVVLRARWSLVTGEPGKAVAAEETEISEPTADASWEALLAAHGRALDGLALAIAGRIDTLAARGGTRGERPTGRAVTRSRAGRAPPRAPCAARRRPSDRRGRATRARPRSPPRRRGA
jgi:hypothetical protein